jgi:hypothetical protein
MQFDPHDRRGCVKKIVAALGRQRSPRAGATTYRGRGGDRACPGPSKSKSIPSFTIGLALQAAAADWPFLPTKTIGGSAMLAQSGDKSRPRHLPFSPAQNCRRARASLSMSQSSHVQRADSEATPYVLGPFLWRQGAKPP